MSSDENDTRPVWPTREMRDYLANLAVALHADNEACAGGQWGGIGHLDALVAAWDAAPADPAEAVRQAFISHEINSDYHGDVVGVEAVLAALGAPKETP